MGEPGVEEMILVAEDNEQVRQLAEIILTQDGYTVITAENGRKALDLLSQPDSDVKLILTDLNMPEMDGRELYLKARDGKRDLKVIYMSGLSDEIVSSESKKDENVFFIQKPFTIKALTGKVREALGKD